MTLSIAPLRRWIVRADGSMFFYLADTAWELLHRLNRDETLHYLRTRAAQGFTAVQAVILSEHSSRAPGCNGLALNANDPTQPNEEFFRHLDWVMDEAAAMGLLPVLGIAWGSRWCDPPGRSTLMTKYPDDDGEPA